MKKRRKAENKIHPIFTFLQHDHITTDHILRDSERSVYLVGLHVVSNGIVLEDRRCHLGAAQHRLLQQEILQEVQLRLRPVVLLDLKGRNVSVLSSHHSTWYVV